MCVPALLLSAEFITAYLNNANNEDDIKNGSALAELYGIQIVPPRYGISKDRYVYDKDRNVIAKGINSIKYMNSTVRTSYTILQNAAIRKPLCRFSP